jgi:hypothetical protein
MRRRATEDCRSSFATLQSPVVSRRRASIQHKEVGLLDRRALQWQADRHGRRAPQELMRPLPAAFSLGADALRQRRCGRVVDIDVVL